MLCLYFAQCWFGYNCNRVATATVKRRDFRTVAWSWRRRCNRYISQQYWTVEMFETNILACEVFQGQDEQNDRGHRKAICVAAALRNEELFQAVPVWGENRSDDP